MGDIVNLNRVRKRTRRERDATNAETNRGRFGRTKSERERADQQAERARELLEQHRIVPKERP